jgi:quercetin dioxygenase-like cupin family protein
MEIKSHRDITNQSSHESENFKNIEPYTFLMKGENDMVTIIKSKKLRIDEDYEPPMKVGFGIDSTSVQNPGMVMGYTTGPVGLRNQRHYHPHTPSGIYVVKGRSKLIVGPDHEKQELIVEAGDFIYVPRGEIHGAVNLEDDTAVVFCYPDVSSKEEAGTIYIEPPHDK